MYQLDQKSSGSQRVTTPCANFWRKLILGVIASVALIAVATIRFESGHPLQEKEYASTVPSEQFSYANQLKRLKSAARRVDDSGDASIVEISEEDLKKFCDEEFAGYKDEQKMSKQLCSEMKLGGRITRETPNGPRILSLQYEHAHAKNLQVIANAKGLTNLRYSSFFGGTGGGSYTWVPMIPFHSFESGCCSNGYMTGFQFFAGGSGSFITAPLMGHSSNMHVGSAAVPGCLSDMKIWHTGLVTGAQGLYCHSNGHHFYDVARGSFFGSNAFAFDNTCAQCGASATSRPCIVGVLGRTGAVVDAIQFVQACVEL